LRCLKLRPPPTTIKTGLRRVNRSDSCRSCVLCVFACLPRLRHCSFFCSASSQSRQAKPGSSNAGADSGARRVASGRTGIQERPVGRSTRAVQLCPAFGSPTLVNARLYLATTYASQYIPGGPSEENRQKGEAAIAEFRELLKIQPDNIAAIDGIGSLLFMMAGQQVDCDANARLS
jgi:hypothetical protein